MEVKYDIISQARVSQWNYKSRDCNLIDCKSLGHTLVSHKIRGIKLDGHKS